MTDEQTEQGGVAVLGSNIETDAPRATRAPRLKVPAQGLPQTKRVILEESDDIPPTGLFVSLNGKGYLIKPGEEVDLPLGVIEILDNAVMSTPVRSATNEVIGYRDKTRFPYRLAK